jgi:hypothetical protein
VVAAGAPAGPGAALTATACLPYGQVPPGYDGPKRAAAASRATPTRSILNAAPERGPRQRHGYNARFCVRPGRSAAAAAQQHPLPALMVDAEAWFAARGWQPHDFQRQVWQAMAAGRSGLLHATTGSGKTYAVWMGALARQRPAAGLQVLWITPMRALAADTRARCSSRWPSWRRRWTVGLRTGDTASAERARQDRAWPPVLVTTPESLTLMLTRERAGAELAGVHTVIVDEWHEMLGSKRGVQVQLALARLKRWNPAAGGVGPVGDAGQPGRGDAHAGGQRPRASWCAAASTSSWSSTR